MRLGTQYRFFVSQAVATIACWEFTFEGNVEEQSLRIQEGHLKNNSKSHLDTARL